MTGSETSAKTIAAIRIVIGIFFLFFAEYKLAGPGFAHGGFQEYLHGYVDTTSISLYRPFLAGVVLPHAVVLGYAVGVFELLVGLSMVLGIWVRPFAVLGALFMLNLTMATFWDPGHGAPTWRYFGAQLDNLPLLFLFLVFFAADAGTTWGLDVRRR